MDGLRCGAAVAAGGRIDFLPAPPALLGLAVCYPNIRTWVDTFTFTRPICASETAVKKQNPLGGNLSPLPSFDLVRLRTSLSVLIRAQQQPISATRETPVAIGSHNSQAKNEVNKTLADKTTTRKNNS